ncbi:MAG: ATP-binding protein [Verrucomicrobiota bacterium]|nr:ATP-binding protein [Verrucomicrobiota bacterium]
MKVQTKISLLLVAVVATFLIGLWAIRSYDYFKFRHIAEHRFEERNQSFDDFLTYYSQQLATFVSDYTAWDQMVNAIGANDQGWFEENLSDPTLEGFHANAVWVCKTDGTAIYERNNLNTGELTLLPLPQEALSQLFAGGPLRHFFTQTAQGLMEIRGGSVHTSRDFSRTTPHGFFFAGRLWSNPTLREMSMFTGNEVKLLIPPPRVGENLNDERDGAIAFSRDLTGWNGERIAELLVRNDSPVVKELNRSSARLLIALAIFSIVLLLILTVSLVRWVRQPLRRTMESLRRNDPQPIIGLCHDNSEFGELARTIRKFFEQRDNLIREIDERRATEEALRKKDEELRQSQKMEAIGRLAGGVAHDFNNLLTAIIGYAELINHRKLTDPTVRQHAELILKAGEQAAALTRQLLAFSRKQLLQPRIIDLNELVVDMEKLLRRVIGERFELATLPEASDGRVMADPSQLEQVILNLGVNARDAMPRGGKLTIRTANVRLETQSATKISSQLQAGDYVELLVIDTGEGMSDETKSHIFEPFFTTKGPGKGTGLGLATVYGIVRQTGGGVAVESELGKGSTFRIYLPLETAPVERTTANVERPDKTGNYETILVAEDEEIVRELVCAVLEDEGYNVICASDGVEALRKASEFDGTIHLLVSDVVMPHMNGPELAAQLTAVRPGVKVLYVSGYSDNDIGDHGVVDTKTELLQKPFTPQALARKIREVFESRSHAQTARA